MKNYEELSKLVTLREKQAEILENLGNTRSLGKGKSLAQICWGYEFHTTEDYREVHDLVTDIAQRRLDDIDYKLSQFSIEKEDKSLEEEVEREVYERLKLKFENK